MRGGVVKNDGVPNEGNVYEKLLFKNQFLIRDSPRYIESVIRFSQTNQKPQQFMIKIVIFVVHYSN